MSADVMRRAWPQLQVEELDVVHGVRTDRSTDTSIQGRPAYVVAFDSAVTGARRLVGVPS
jgi:hypothetical protein